MPEHGEGEGGMGEGRGGEGGGNGRRNRGIDATFPAQQLPPVCSPALKGFFSFLFPPDLLSKQTPPSSPSRSGIIPSSSTSSRHYEDCRGGGGGLTPQIQTTALAPPPGVDIFCVQFGTMFYLRLFANPQTDTHFP